MAAGNVELAIMAVTFCCPKHGQFEMVRAYQEGMLLRHGGDMFPCRCWYELKDEWLGEQETPPTNSIIRDVGQLELLNESRVYPQGGAG